MITKLFRFYVLSSTHVGLAVLSLLAIVHLQYDLSWQYPLFIFVFCATVVTYNFIRYFPLSEANATLIRPIFIFSLLAGIGLCISVTKLTFHTLLLASFLGVLSFSYVLPNNRFFAGLRQLPYLKSFVVVSCWASVVVLLPLINHQSQLSTSTVVGWIQMALWTFATMIPFEIRDSYGDSDRMKTIPQIFGIKGSKMIGTLFLIAVVILSYFLINEIEDMTPTVLTAAIATVLLRKSNEEQSPYYASFWVESLPMVWLLSTLFWKWI